jgi:PAS domain S-box-containing protein
MKLTTKTILLAVSGAILCAGLAYAIINLSTSGNIALTPTEKQWLSDHVDTIRIAPLPDSPPIDFFGKDGAPKGLTTDYARLIEQKLGIRFSIVQCNSWKEILEKLKAGEVDVVGSIQNTEDRHDFLRFTRPYLEIPNVILTRKGAHRTGSIKKMAGMSIAIVDGSATHDHLAKAYPHYRFVPVKDATSGFDMVSFREVDAMVADLGVASYYIGQRGISNLRVDGDIDYPWKLCFASRKDWPMLSRVLDKALANISTQQHHSIRREWITLHDALIIPRDRYLKIIGLVLLLTLLSIGGIMLWNRSLKQQVTHHSRELGRVRESHEQATQALDISEERFRVMVESSGDIVWEMDRHGNYSYISPRVRDILGFDPRQLIGRSVFSLMIPEDAAYNMQHLRKATVNTTMNCETFTYVHRNGQKVILETSGTAFTNNVGELAGFRGVSRNITARIEAAAALKASEERFRNLVETTSDWIWEVDTEGRFTYTSPQANGILGYAANELLGKRFTYLLPEKEAATAKETFRNAVQNGTPFDAQINTYRHKNGRLFAFETSAVPFYDKKWEIKGYRGIGRNITERMAAEEERFQATKELLTLRNLLSSIINSMPSILVGVDATGAIMQWNREAERVTGTDADKALGQQLEQALPILGDEMVRVLHAIDQRELHRGQRISCIIDNTPHVIDVTVYPIKTDENEGAVIRVDDVTDRSRMEEVIVQSEKMMSVGGLAAGMAHEINNPLAGILQNLQVMRNRVTHDTEINQNAAKEAGTSLKAIQTYMQERGLLNMMESVIEAGSRASNIVDNMLSFSRKDEAHFAPNNLAEILERSIELASNDYNLKKRFDFRHIQIQRDFDETLGPVPCEKNQIQQVILNLLSNSAQAMAEQTDPQKEPRISLSLKKEPGMVLIEVEDNGPGMDAKTRKRVFEPFFTTKEVGRGTGLGLSVSYFIITENHGGTMQVDSSPNRGTRFSIRIPLKSHRSTENVKI